MNDKIKERRIIDISYNVSLFLKGVDSIIEIISGIGAFFLTQTFVIKVAIYLTQDELSDDPKDAIANYLLNLAHSFSIGSKDFLVFYLLSHGIIKLFVVISLWKKKMWAYPLSFVVFTLFIIYQLYRFTYTHSLWLIVLTVFDILVLWLIWKEYSYVKAKINK